MYKTIEPYVDSEPDAIYLASLLLVPSMGVPFVLNFFSQGRIALLESCFLRRKLWQVLLCPHVLQQQYSAITLVPVSGADRPKYLGTPRGLLMHEMEHSPDAVLEPLTLLLHQACDLIANDDSTSMRHRLMTFLLRVSCIVEHFAASSAFRSSETVQVLAFKHRKHLQIAQRKCLVILASWVAPAELQDGMDFDRSYAVAVHSALALLHAIPSLSSRHSAHSDSIDFPAFYFSATTVMTFVTSQDCVACPIMDVLHATHRVRLDATQLVLHNESERHRILHRMWLAQRDGKLPSFNARVFRPFEHDLGIFVEQAVTLDFGRVASPEGEGQSTLLSFPGVNRIHVHIDDKFIQRAGENFDCSSFFCLFRTAEHSFFEGPRQRWFQKDLASGKLVAECLSDSVELFKYSSSCGSEWNVRLNFRAPIKFSAAQAVAHSGNCLSYLTFIGQRLTPCLQFLSARRCCIITSKPLRLH